MSLTSVHKSQRSVGSSIQMRHRLAFVQSLNPTAGRLYFRYATSDVTGNTCSLLPLHQTGTVALCEHAWPLVLRVLWPVGDKFTGMYYRMQIYVRMMNVTYVPGL